MLTLPEEMPAQSRFAAALMADDACAPDGLLTREGALLRDRFGIYRNNVAASLGAVLLARFPAIDRLVGHPFFANMAREFMRTHPPISPVLMEYGGAMPDFLRRFQPTAHLAYLPDVAQLEWQGHAALHAADATPINPAELATVPPDRMARLRFEFHPSLSLVKSTYPIVSIWRANTSASVNAPLPANLPAESALILRPDLATAVHAITPAQASLYARLLAGDPLGVAAGRAEPEVDLTAALTLLFRAGAITGYGLASLFQLGVDHHDCTG